MIENKQAQNTENLETLILDISNEAISIEQKQKKKIISINSIFNSINDWIIDLSTVPLQEKLLFFQLLGAMVNAGLPILECLTLLHDQTKHAKMKIVIKEIKTLIESGESLAQAMRANDDVFDDATCSVIEAGEKSGKLNEILKELVDQYEQLNSLSKKMKAAMTYPVVVITVMILLTIVILVFVVPKLEELFGGAANLPLPTRILIGTSDFVLNQSFLFLSFIIASVASFLTWKKSKVGKKQWGRFLLVIPLVGDILQKMILTRISRIFGFLMTSGVPIVESLKIASHIAENDLYQEKLLLVADDLTKGISIAENLSDDEDLFPKMLVNMMAIGEKTASLDTVMSKAADFYKDELERKIEALSKIMEPIILAFIAFGAVFMILAIYLPILKMNDQILT